MIMKYLEKEALYSANQWAKKIKISTGKYPSYKKFLIYTRKQFEFLCLTTKEKILGI